MGVPFAFPFWSIILVILSTNGVTGSSLFPAMFVFGDSLIDNGNNNYLTSWAKANYVPYGIDFLEGPTGRFCNGKTIVDFLGDLVGLPLLPAFANTLTGVSNIVSGVNFASAAGGILEETGQNLGGRFSFSRQVGNFETILRELKRQINEKELSQYLAKSLIFVDIGNNDYINNYLLPMSPSSSTYDPQSYSDLLIDNYRKQILALHGLGLRKFLLGAVGPLGCTPSQLLRGVAPPGNCVSYVNDMAQMFNVKLKSLVGQLNSEHAGSIFVYGDTYGVFLDILKHANDYGFTITDQGCCGVGRNRAEKSCPPFTIPCLNRDQYVFWDAFHPSQAFNKILATRAFNGPPSDCYPINVKQMADL